VTTIGRSTREVVIGAILEFLSGQDPRLLAHIRGALERDIDEAGPDALVTLKERLTEDHGWNYYPPDPLARRIHHLLADLLLQPDSALVGGDNLAHLSTGPVALFANHLSYSDANLIEILLHRAGWDAIATRLAAIAGPKIFTSRQRRFSSLCFGTVKVPQSAEVSSEEAVLSPREVARAARQSIEAAHERLVAGDVLVIFGEGRRSRSGEMQPMLAGVSRYLDVPDTTVLPVGLSGTDALFPIGDETIRPARIVVQIGRPFGAAALIDAAGGDRRLIMDAIGLAIAAELPEASRGVYTDASSYPDAARILAAAR
jgi:1-acyl-sn-glycerol-3-phosphate acyltransferase